MLEPGIHGERTVIVTEALTARSMGSGELMVFATPAMAALMEETAWRSVAGELPAGSGTVGTALELSHLAPTPLGAEVRCISKLVRTEGRTLEFELEVYDPAGLVGRGRHERVIVDNARFSRKAESRIPSE